MFQATAWETGQVALDSSSHTSLQLQPSPKGAWSPHQPPGQPSSPSVHMLLSQQGPRYTCCCFMGTVPNRAEDTSQRFLCGSVTHSFTPKCFLHQCPQGSDQPRNNQPKHKQLWTGRLYNTAELSSISSWQKQRDFSKFIKVHGHTCYLTLREPLATSKTVRVWHRPHRTAHSSQSSSHLQGTFLPTDDRKNLSSAGS